jgi:DNA-binding PadR family transcriptional regulator
MVSKRSDLTPLEAFILALMLGGMPLTHSDLQVNAGFSPGAAIPALKRLEEKGLIELKSDRNRFKPYVITTAGERVLDDQWFPLLTRPASDWMDILRIAWLPIALGKADVAAKYLRKSGRDLRKLAETFDIDTSPSISLITRYKNAHDAVRSSSYLAEADVLIRLARHLERSGQAHYGETEDDDREP